MTTNGKYQSGKSGNAATQFKPGNRHRWQPGQSGNLAGIVRSRLQFEESFYEALLGHGSANEVAGLLWEAARKREPWAIQAILQRLAPEAKQINITHGMQDESHIDYSRLSAKDLDTLEEIFERAAVPTGTGEEGESAAQPEGLRDSGMAGPGTEH
jgi:hypothetical protein